MKKTLIRVLFCSLSLSGCHQSQTEPEVASPHIDGQTIRFAPGSRQLAEIAIESARKPKSAVVKLTGRIVWNEDVTVRIYTSLGGRVAQILSPVGQKVEKNTPLALIDSSDFGQVQADAARAALDLRLAEQNLTRLKELAGYGAAAQKDLRAAEIDFTRAQRESENVARRLMLYGGSPESTDQQFILRSPLSGVVVEKNINPGQEVRPDQMTANAPPLFVVTDPTRLWVILDATESAFPLVKVGDEVTLRADHMPGEGFRARVETIGDAVDPSSRTIKIRGSLENPLRKLKAEMFVTAELSLEAPSGVEVPVDSVFLKKNQHCLFIRAGAGAFQERAVQVVSEHDGFLLIASGVALGESVVTDGALMLDQILSDSSEP
jgi:cobalt-zinc-cadmium efflux system membrane fusion protein